MATKKSEKSDQVQAFVLVDCNFGACGSVILLSPADAQTGEQNGLLDLHPDAIAAHLPTKAD